ncbi:MAG: helix-turn-helix domain-containing protein [Chitinivibrionia bacterium]|nr:helix-turn-helix domain-containing protein [Chitinivibrionia bacterium]
MPNLPFNSIGEMLRRAREQKRCSLDDVNRHTKISVPVLQALEQEDFDSFESDTYLRGFLKNYAAFLDVDFEVLMTTLERQRGRAHSGKGTLWDIEETMTEEKLKSPRIISRIVLPALVLVILVLSLLQIRSCREIRSLKSGRSQIQSLDRNEGGAETRLFSHRSSGSNGNL